MATTIKRTGFGQVEPNHLSAQRTGQIYAQLPAAASVNILENGQFAKYDYATNNGEVNFTGKGEWMLVFNEIKLYDDFWRESYKDFAMIRDNYYEGGMVPRLLKTNVGDIMTTNCIKAGNTSGKVEQGGEELAVNDYLTVNAQGFLEKNASADPTDGKTFIWQVVKETTMPDGQPAVKIMRVQ